MNIGILGTGTVGQTIDSKLIQLGHEVGMSSRTADNEKAARWVAANGPRASHGTFADAAAFGEIPSIAPLELLPCRRSRRRCSEPPGEDSDRCGEPAGLFARYAAFPGRL